MVRKQGLWGFTMKNKYAKIFVSARFVALIPQPFVCVHLFCNLHTKVEISFYKKKNNFGP